MASSVIEPIVKSLPQPLNSIVYFIKHRLLFLLKSKLNVRIMNSIGKKKPLLVVCGVMNNS